jgi:hypothetical protein
VNKDISDKLKYLEDQIQEISNKNDELQKQIQKKDQTESFLKRLVTKVSKVYGFENIKSLIDSVRSEIQDAPERVPPSQGVSGNSGALEDIEFYESLFSRKASTASTQADTSDLNFYPIFEEKPPMSRLSDSHPQADPHGIWQDESHKLSFLPRVDSDFGIGGLNAKTNFAFEKINGSFPF